MVEMGRDGPDSVFQLFIITIYLGKRLFGKKLTASICGG